MMMIIIIISLTIILERHRRVAGFPRPSFNRYLIINYKFSARDKYIYIYIYIYTDVSTCTLHYI
jgi:hypothetical protein